LEGFGVQNNEGDYVGFGVDLCYAVAAALFGEDYRDRVIFLREEIDVGFTALENREIDLMAKVRSHTMEQEVSLTGFSFTTPYLYTGLVFGGEPSYVTCAENKNTTGACNNLKVCVKAESPMVDVVRSLLPEENMFEVVISFFDEYVNYLNSPTCNVIADNQPIVAGTLMRPRKVIGPYKIGNQLMSNHPLAMVTRDDDPSWSDFVTWVLQALIIAEKHNITQQTASEMPATDVFGEKFKNMFINAIRAVGNYGEIYTRHLEDIIPRQDTNVINDGTSGLIFSHPFGNLLGSASSGHVEGGILEKIFQRGYLKCGILDQNTLGRFDTEKHTPSGLGVDYCYALSAGIFRDYTEETKNNYTKIFPIVSTSMSSSLNQHEMDVINLVEVNLINDVSKKMSFSQPIFYNSQEGPLALATYQDDVQWAYFVYWAVSATFYAEERNITKESSNEMPLLNLFGPHHKPMMRNIIKAVGNYGDIYDRNTDDLGPRAGINMLSIKNSSRLHAFPGIFDSLNIVNDFAF